MTKRLDTYDTQGQSTPWLSPTHEAPAKRRGCGADQVRSAFIASVCLAAGAMLAHFMPMSDGWRMAIWILEGVCGIAVYARLAILAFCVGGDK
jgi:hypothetical protein